MADSIQGAPLTANNTGKSRTRDYNLGRGKSWFHELDAETGALDQDGWIYPGNTVVATATMSREVIDHITSESGFRDIDAQIPIQNDLRGRLEFDQLNSLIRDYFYSAAPEAIVNGTIAGSTKFTLIPAAQLGRSFEIYNVDGDRCYGVDSDDILLEVGSTQLELGVDYEVDEAAGEILILSTSPEVEPDDPIDLTLTPNPLAAADMEQAPVHSRELIEVAYKFHAVSPRKVDGVNRRYVLWVPKCSLVPEGDFPLLSPPDAREVQRVAFTWTALKRDANTALGYVIPLPVGGIT